MSHMTADGIPITDLSALQKSVAGCPDLYMRRDSIYRWYGRNVGDAAPSGLDQIEMFKLMLKSKLDIRKIASEAGVTLPENIGDLENSPLSLKDINKLKKNSDFKTAYDLQADQLGKDAEFVIGYKKGHPLHGKAYEIGVTKHPIRDEYYLKADYWNNGGGLFDAEGLGGVEPQEDKSVQFANKLKQRYTLHAMTNAAKAAGHKNIKVKTLPTGEIVLETEQ
jgi:hypothetical protein